MRWQGKVRGLLAMTTISALDPNLRTNDETAALLDIKPNTLEN